MDQGGDNERFQPHHNWKVLGDTLYFDPHTQPTTSEGQIRLTYNAHPSALAALTGATGTFNRHVESEYMAWLSVVKLLEWRDKKFEGRNAVIQRELNNARMKVEEWEQQQPELVVEKKPSFARW